MSHASEQLSTQTKYKVPAVFAMLVATLMMAFAPIFVRVCELNGSSMTFWRMILAMPFLMLGWLLFPAPSKSTYSQSKLSLKAYALLVLAGVAFAFDLIIWNYGVAFTTIANATLFVNFAPLIVGLISWRLLKRPLSRNLTLGMITALLGGTLLVLPHMTHSSSHFLGDALSLLAACFYGVYLIGIQEARKFFNTYFIMVSTGIITALTALGVALVFSHSLNIESPQGWQALLGLALVVQVFGQGLIAYALADLSAALSSVMLLMQPVFSAIIAWWLFGEQLLVIQIIGMMIVLIGIGVAKANPVPKGLAP